MSKTLPPEYKIVALPREEFQKYWGEWGPKIFRANDTSMDMRLVLSDQEREQVQNLHKNLSQGVNLNLCIFKGQEFCGWFTGDQYGSETFYMRNSAILPEHRRLGLYTALMNEVLARVKALGFQNIFSRHTTTNNSIIIPKLKAGFTITAIEVSDRFGTLVHLTYFFNETRKQIMEFRAGNIQPNQKIKEALRLE